MESTLHSCINLFSVATILLVLSASLVPTCSEPAGSSASARANLENLGLMLGVPVDVDVGPKRNSIPPFLQNVYECWNSERQNCMPEEASDVNVVRSVIGTVEANPAKAVQSNNQDAELRNSMSIVFNMSFTLMQQEAVRYAMFRIHKEPLTEEQKQDVESKCDITGLKLQLYTTVKVSGQEEEVVTLKDTVPFEANTLLRRSWFSFHNLTDVYSTQYTALSEKTSTNYHTFSLRVAIAGSCSELVSPSLLGFKSITGFEPQIIGFAKNDIQDGLLGSKIFSSIAHSQAQRRRRQTAETVSTPAENIASGDLPTPVDGTRPTYRPPQTVQEYQDARCRLYRHNISFVDLGWDQYIIEPIAYEANFCAGRCNWPLVEADNTTKHSYIQGIGNLNHPDIIPPPCCVPLPERLGTLTVVLQHSQDNVVVRKWTDMIANSCGCL